MERKKSLSNTTKQALNVKTKRSPSVPYISRHAINTLNNSYPIKMKRSHSIDFQDKCVSRLEANMPVITINDKPIRKYSGPRHSSSNDGITSTTSALISWKQNAHPGCLNSNGENSRDSFPSEFFPKVCTTLQRERRNSCCDSISTVLCSDISSTKSSRPLSSCPCIKPTVVQGSRLEEWLTKQSKEKQRRANTDVFPEIKQVIPSSSFKNQRIS